MGNEHKDWHTRFDDNITAFDSLPRGWVKSFVPKMKDDLLEALGPYAEDFVILEAKEKWGELRIYWNWGDRDYTNEECDDLNKLYNAIENIIDEYSELSRKICVKCGAVATHFKDGLPYCEEDK